MKNFKDGGFRKGGFNGPKFGGGKHGGDKRRGGGGRDREGRKAEMFSAVCSTCGKTCEVPFRPSGDKPVYCSECFTKRSPDEAGGLRGVHRDGGGRNDSRHERPDYTKLPRQERPPRHDPSRGREDGGHDEIKQRLATIESRLNRILDIINPPTAPTKAVEAEKIEKKVEKKTPKKAVKKAIVKKKAPAKKPVAKKPAKKAPAKKPAKKAKK